MSPQPTPKALELIAKVEARNAAKVPIVAPHTSTWKPKPYRWESKTKENKPPEDLNRRRYTNWGGVDRVHSDGQVKNQTLLSEEPMLGILPNRGSLSRRATY
jgi:hypothetical protein